MAAQATLSLPPVLGYRKVHVGTGWCITGIEVGAPDEVQAYIGLLGGQRPDPCQLLLLESQRKVVRLDPS